MLGNFFAAPEPGAPIAADELEHVAQSLTRTRFREGYDTQEVDAFIVEAVAALRAAAHGRAPALTGDDVLIRKFRTTKFREGYDQDQVDDLLDRVSLGLRPARGGASSPSGADGPAAQPITSAELRQAVAGLARTRVKEGYDRGEVTAFLDEVLPALDDVAAGRRPRVPAQRVTDVKFKATLFQPGYDQDQVDDLLDRVVATLQPAD